MKSSCAAAPLLSAQNHGVLQPQRGGENKCALLVLQRNKPPCWEMQHLHSPVSPQRSPGWDGPAGSSGQQDKQV